MKAHEVGLKEREWDLLLQRLGREPNDLELQMVGVMWSEHCSYKSTRRLLKELPQKGEGGGPRPRGERGGGGPGRGLGTGLQGGKPQPPLRGGPLPGSRHGGWGASSGTSWPWGLGPWPPWTGCASGIPRLPGRAHLATGIVEGIGGYGNAVGVPTVGGLTLHDPCYDDNPPGERLLRRSGAALPPGQQPDRHSGADGAPPGLQDRAGRHRRGGLRLPGAGRGRGGQPPPRSRSGTPSRRSCSSKPAWSCWRRTSSWACRTWGRRGSSPPPARWPSKAAWA